MIPIIIFIINDLLFLSRVSDEETCITFETARSAINAVSFNGQEVCDSER